MNKQTNIVRTIIYKKEQLETQSLEQRWIEGKN